MTNVYTAADAVEDGSAVHFNPATALGAGYLFPVILTRRAFEEVVEWTRPDRGLDQGMDARFGALLSSAREASSGALRDGRTYLVEVERIPNASGPGGALSQVTAPVAVMLAVRVEGFNMAGDPCLVISLPHNG